jgi:hypothetical protein
VGQRTSILNIEYQHLRASQSNVIGMASLRGNLAGDKKQLIAAVVIVKLEIEN